jgi:hypothetical protein
MEGNCAKCGMYRWSLDQDHIIPKSKGGTDDPSNIQYLCQNCHADKTHQDRKGIKASPETREKRSLLMKQKFEDPEYKEKIASVHRGRKRSDITRARLSAAQTGRQLSEQTRRRISNAKKRQNLSPETIEKMRAAKEGRPLSDSHRQNIKTALASSVRMAEYQVRRATAALQRLQQPKTIEIDDV